SVETCTDAQVTSRSVASTSPFVFTATSESPPRAGPLVSKGTGPAHDLPPLYEGHSSGPFGSPMPTTYSKFRLAVGEVSIAIDGSPPWPPGRTTSGPNEGLAPSAEAGMANAANPTITAANAALRSSADPRD